MGATWTPEVRVSDGGSAAENPCIASDETGAYISYLEFGETQIKKYTNGIWSNYNPASGVFASSIASPVIEVSGQDNVIFSVWEKYNGKLGYYINMNGTIQQGFIP